MTCHDCVKCPGSVFAIASFYASTVECYDTADLLILVNLNKLNNVVFHSRFDLV